MQSVRSTSLSPKLLQYPHLMYCRSPWSVRCFAGKRFFNMGRLVIANGSYFCSSPFGVAILYDPVVRFWFVDLHRIRRDEGSGYAVQSLSQRGHSRTRLSGSFENCLRPTTQPFMLFSGLHTHSHQQSPSERMQCQAPTFLPQQNSQFCHSSCIKIIIM